MENFGLEFSMVQLLVKRHVLMLIKSELNGNHTPSFTTNGQSLQKTLTINLGSELERLTKKQHQFDPNQLKLSSSRSTFILMRVVRKYNSFLFFYNSNNELFHYLKFFIHLVFCEISTTIKILSLKCTCCYLL